MKRLFASALLAALAAGCAAPEKPPMQRTFGVPDGMVKYPKIIAPDLYLDMISKPLLYAGGPGELVFALRNSGQKAVTIDEWYRNEGENLILLVQPCLPGMKAPDPAAWIEIAEPVRKPVIHYPLMLMPDNRVMIAKKLDFIGKMQVTPGMERRFFLQAKLTLKSLDLSTEIITLRVLPARKEKETKKP